MAGLLLHGERINVFPCSGFSEKADHPWIFAGSVGVVHNDNMKYFNQLFLGWVDEPIRQMFLNHRGEISQNHPTIVVPESLVSGYFNGASDYFIYLKLDICRQAALGSIDGGIQVGIGGCPDLIGNQFGKIFFTHCQRQLAN